MIAEILSPLRPDLSSAQLAQFETYYAMLADWNTFSILLPPRRISRRARLWRMSAQAQVFPEFRC